MIFHAVFASRKASMNGSSEIDVPRILSEVTHLEMVENLRPNAFSQRAREIKSLRGGLLSERAELLA